MVTRVNTGLEIPFREKVAIDSVSDTTAKTVAAFSLVHTFSMPEGNNSIYPKDIKLTANGKVAVVIFFGGVQAYSLENKKMLWALEIPRQYDQVRISPDGKNILVYGQTRIIERSTPTGVRIIDLETGKMDPKGFGNDRLIEHLQFSADGKKLYTASRYASAIKSWNFVTKRLIKIMEPQIEGSSTVHYIDPNGVFALSENGSVGPLVWDLATGRLMSFYSEQVKRITHREMQILEASPDGGLMVASDGSQLKVWRLTKHVGIEDFGEVRAIPSLSDKCNHLEDRTFACNHGIYQMRVASDNRSILLGGMVGTLGFFDLETGLRLNDVKAHDGIITSMQMSLDGMRVVSGSVDKTVKVWELCVPKSVDSRGVLPGVRTIVQEIMKNSSP